MIQTLVAILLSLTIAPALAAGPKWTVIGTNQQMTIQVDVSSIKRLSDGNVQVWTRVNYRTPQLTRNGKQYDQLDRLSVYNCEARTRRPVQIIMYRSTEVIDSERVGENIIPIVPRTFAESTLNWACSHKVAVVDLIPARDRR